MELKKLYQIIKAQKLVESQDDKLFNLIDGIYQKETTKALNRTISQVKPVLEQKLNQTLTNDEAQLIVKKFIEW
jgi:hypothetical protein